MTIYIYEVKFRKYSGEETKLLMARSLSEAVSKAQRWGKHKKWGIDLLWINCIGELEIP